MCMPASRLGECVIVVFYLSFRRSVAVHETREHVRVVAARFKRDVGIHDGGQNVFEGILVIGLILRSLWGLYKIHETLWFYLVSL